MVHIKPRNEPYTPSISESATVREPINKDNPQTAANPFSSNSNSEDQAVFPDEEVISAPALFSSSLSTAADKSTTTKQSASSKPSEKRLESCGEPCVRVTRPKRQIRIPEKLKDFDLS